MPYEPRIGDRVLTIHGPGTIIAFAKNRVVDFIEVRMDSSPYPRSFAAYEREDVRPTITTEIIHGIRGSGG